MASVTTDRRRGINSSAAIKNPCIAATTADITLSGEQTIDGVSCTSGDRVLVMNQTTASENGIYNVSTGSWTRAPDWDGYYDVLTWTFIPVYSGTTNKGYFRVTTTGTITVGSTSVAFEASDVDSLLRADLAAATSSSYGTGLIGWMSSLTGVVKRTLYNWMSDREVSITDFMTSAQRSDFINGTGSVDLTSPLQAALDTGKDILVPNGRGLTGALTVTTAGQTIRFMSINAIIELDNSAENLFTVSANDVTFLGGRLDGPATDNTTTSFAIFTASGSPADSLKVIGTRFSGKSSSKGFNNAVKFDTGSDFGLVEDCTIERLWGNISGTGYGVLAGDVNGAKAINNWFFGSSGRGRHAVYFSAGCSDSLASGNYVDSFDYEGITQYSNGVEPSCIRNKITNNTVINCAASGNATSGGIGVYGHSDLADIDGNISVGSGAVGIAVSGATFTDCKDTKVRNNTVDTAQREGIQAISAVGLELTDNHVRESSQASAGTYANIQLKSDGTTATSDVLVSGNKSIGTSFSRAAFQIDATAPTATNIKLMGNFFPTNATYDYELNSVVCEIDGRLQYSSTAYDPASIAAGAVAVDTITVTGATAGDICTASLANIQSGMDICASCAASSSVEIKITNDSTSTIDLAATTLRIDVWKRDL